MFQLRGTVGKRGVYVRAPLPSGSRFPAFLLRPWQLCGGFRPLEFQLLNRRLQILVHLGGSRSMTFRYRSYSRSAFSLACSAEIFPAWVRSSWSSSLVDQSAIFMRRPRRAWSSANSRQASASAPGSWFPSGRSMTWSTPAGGRPRNVLLNNKGRGFMGVRRPRRLPGRVRCCNQRRDNSTATPK